MSAPKPGGPADNLLKELQQGRKMQMIEALEIKLLEDQRRSLRHFELVQDGLAKMRSGAVMITGRPQTTLGTYGHGSEAEKRAEAIHRMSFSESLRREIESARAACTGPPASQEPSEAPQAVTEAPPSPPVAPAVAVTVAEPKPSVAISIAEPAPEKPTTPSTTRTEKGGQTSLGLKSFKSMKTAGTVKFRQQGSGEDVENAETLSSFTDISPVHRPSEADDLLGFIYHHVEKTQRSLDPADPLRHVPLVCHAGAGERLPHKSFVVDFAFRGDGTWLASADDEGHVACWQANPPATVWEATTSSVSRFATSPSGKHVAAANLRGRIYVWDTVTSKSVTKEMPEEVMVLRFIADDKLAVALSDSVRLFAIPEFQEVVELVQPGVSVLCASPDGTTLVSVGGAADPSLPHDSPDAEGCVIWDVSVFGRIGSIVFAHTVHALAYQPDGARMAAAGDGKLISIFGIEPFEHSFDLPCAASVRALAWSPSIRCLASGGEDGTIRVWDLVRKQSLFQLSEHQECISSLSWSSRGVLAFGHVKAKEICIALLDELPSQPSEIPSEVAPSSSKDTAEPTPSFVLSVQMVSSASGTPIRPPEPEQGQEKSQDDEGFTVQIQRDRMDADPASLHLGPRNRGLQQSQPASSVLQDNGDLVGCVFMPHDQSIMVAGKNIVEHQVQQRHRIREVGLPQPASVLAVSPCGGFLAAACDNRIMVYRLTAAREEPVLSRKVESTISALAVSAQNFLAVGLGDKVLVCHLSDNKDPRQLVMTGQVYGLAFSPAGDVLAVAAGGENDSRARTSVWLVARDHCQYLGAAMSKQARAVSFSSSGKILAVGCDDGKIPLLLPEHGFKCWTELRLVGEHRCRSLAWAGFFLAAAGPNQVSIFNVSSSQVVLQIPSYEETILNLSMSANGSMLALCCRSHVTLHHLQECEAEVVHTKPSIQVPSDREKMKSKGTTANLGEVLESSGSLIHSIKLTFPGEAEADDAELRAPYTRMNSVGSCGKLQKGETAESDPGAERTPSAKEDAADDGDLRIPGLSVLKPRISVTDLSQDGQSGRNTPEEEDAEAAQLRRRALLARDLGLDPSLLCKISTARRPEGVPIKLKHEDEVCSLSFSSCSTRLAAGGYDQHLVIWDAQSMERVGAHHLEAEVLCVAFSPCGKYVYCGDNDREVNVFDAATMQVLGKEVLKEPFVSLVGISSPTSLLAVGSHIVVKIFSVPDVEEVITLQHGGQVHSLTYAPSLGILAAAGGINITESGLLSYSSSSYREGSSAGMKAIVWKSSGDFAAIWDEVGSVSYKEPCHASSFSPSGKVLALGGEDRTISLLSVEKKFRKVEQLPCAAGIRCLAWASGSRLLASAGEDMRVSVWDVLYKRVILHLPKADDWLCSVAFSADSKWLAACGYGQNTVDLWPIEVETVDLSSND